MTVASLTLSDLLIENAADVHRLLRRLGYDAYEPSPFEGTDLDEFELDNADRRAVERAYIVATRGNHSVYLYEVNDLSAIRLRGLAWHALQRGTALLLVTRDYREVVFVDPRFVGSATKSSVRVNKLKMVTADPTRHDLDTLNTIHAHRRSAQQIYDAQAEAFNVNAVTKRFYDEYRRHYEHARALIQQYNPGVREFQNEEESDKLHAFTQRLLGRLMFLYFLQRKGWLGGKGRFLTDRYNETMRQHAGEHDQETFYYYREVLEALFFQTMNSKRPGDITLWSGIRIPYLNGGLFDEARDPAGPILLPDALFDPQSADGLLAFFNRYNFTIADDTPLEQDVAVDPEMLGKVFENMLEERDRGQSGSFYTPRTIVAYMCQEALAGYLEESGGIPRETTRAQFDPDSEQRLTPEQAQAVGAALDTLTVLDPAVGSGSFLVGMMAEIMRLRAACYAALEGQGSIPAALLANWKEAIIRDTLYGVDIKPEAIEIAQLRLWLALVVDQTLEQARPLPNLDYKLMAGNSLIETIDGEPVLGEFAETVLHPGADVQWDAVRDQLAMFEPNPTQGRMLLFDEEKQVQHERIRLDELRGEFFNSTGTRRRELREEIAAQERRIVYASLNEKAEKLQAQIDHYGKLAGQGSGRLKAADEKKLAAAVAKLAHITRLQEQMAKPDAALPFFLYRLHFSEVFERKGGFDVVIANPPYVRGELLGDLKDEFKITPIYKEVYAGTADLYVYFYAQGYDLLKPGGQIAYITSNKYLRAGYGRGLRQFLSANIAMRAIIDFGDLPVFEAAAYPCIVIGDKRGQTAEPIPAVAVKSMDGLEDLRGALAEGVKLAASDLGTSEWQIASAGVQRVFAKLKAAGRPLGEYVDGKIYRGVLTGFNEAFVIDAAKRDELIAADPRSAEVIKPWLRGRDVKRWQVDSKDLFLIAIQNSGDASADNAWAAAEKEADARAIFQKTYPALHEHLSQYEPALRIRQDQGRWWWELRACAYYAEFEKPKIVYQEIATFQAFAFTRSNYYLNNKCFIVPIEDIYLLGVLNSLAAWLFLGQIVSKLQGGAYAMQSPYLFQLPIPNPPADLRERIATQARRCLDAAESAPGKLPALEAELNALVYAAYGLDADDIAVIEGQIGGRGGVELDRQDDEGEDEA